MKFHDETFLSVIKCLTFMLVISLVVYFLLIFVVTPSDNDQEESGRAAT